LLPLLVALGYVIQQSLAESRSQTIKNEVVIGDVIAKGVSETLQETEAVLTDTAANADVRSLNPTKSADILNQVSRLRPSLYGTTLFAADRSIVASSDLVVDPDTLSLLLASEIDQVMTAGEPIISPPIPVSLADGSSEDNRAVAVVIPVRADVAENTSGTPIGVLVGLLSIDRLDRQFVSPLSFAENDTVAAVVSNGQVITTQGRTGQSDQVITEDLMKPIEAAVAGKRSNLTYTSPSGQERIAVFAPVDYAGADWAVVVSNPAPTATGDSRDYVTRSMIALGIAVLFTLALAVILAEFASRPVRDLTVQAEAIAHGDYSRGVNPVGSGELIELSEAVGDMADRLTTQVRDLEAARAEVATQAERLRDLLRRTVRLQEDERRRIASDMHDAVSPLITGALYQTRALQLGGEAQQDGVEQQQADDLAEINNLLERAMDEIHSVIFALRPPDLDDLGVEAAIERYVNQINRTGLPTTFEVIGEARRLSPEARLAVYRIVQEALHNSLRHAQADEAVVKMEWTDDVLRVSIRDNGSGFDPEHATNATSLGLLSMRERASSIGATLIIASQPGDGALVVIERPYGPTVSVEGPEPAVEQISGSGWSVAIPLGAEGR
jgi:signal transduction histidine kinase